MEGVCFQVLLQSLAGVSNHVADNVQLLCHTQEPHCCPFQIT